VPERLVARLLREWREAERLAAATPVGTADHEAAQQEADRLRIAYHEAERALWALIRNGEVEAPSRDAPAPPAEPPGPRKPPDTQPPEA
jgi:hypothetical protein